MAHYAGAPAQAAPLWGYVAPNQLGRRIAVLSRTEASLFQVQLSFVRMPAEDLF